MMALVGVQAPVRVLGGVEALVMALSGVEALDGTTVISCFSFSLTWEGQVVGHQNHRQIHCMFLPYIAFLCTFCILWFSFLFPSIADLYLLSLGLPASLFRIGGHNLNPRSTEGHCFLSVNGFTHFSAAAQYHA